MKNIIEQKSIPTAILTRQDELEITDSELLTLIQLITVDNFEINLQQFLNDFGISTKEKILNLKEKNLLEIDVIDQIPTVNLQKLYDKLLVLKNNNLSESFEETFVDKSNEHLTRSFIDELQILIERQLTNYELGTINSWLKSGHNHDQIKNAFIKSLSLGVDNFKYIEKVLQNNQNLNSESSTNNSGQIKRDWKI